MLLVAVTWVLPAAARAENEPAIAKSERASPIVVGTTHPVHIQLVMVGRGTARSEMEQAVRELVGTMPELTWTDGGAGPIDRTTPVMQVLVDVTDETSIRIVASRASAGTQPAVAPPSPIVREVVTAGLSAPVARETVAQIVQTLVRALLDPTSAPAPLLEPPPITPLLPPMPVPPPAPVGAARGSEASSPATVIRAPEPASRPRMHGYNAIISVGEHSFPYDLAGPLALQPRVDAVAVSLDRRYARVTATARLSVEWSRHLAGAVNVATQILTASAGTFAGRRAGPVSFALGVDVGALLIRQSTSLADSTDLGAIFALGFPGVLWDAWSAGPMGDLRASMSVDLFSRAFVRFEAALPVAWLNTRDINGDSAWRVSRYEQLMLGVGYHL